VTDREQATDSRRNRFRSAEGRRDINPYVEKLSDWAPISMTAEEGEGRKGRWRAEMGLPPDAPLFLEIGPGNGFFFRDLSARHPDAGVLGVEIRFKRVWLTARKARQAGRVHVRVVHHHAHYLADLVAPGELDRIYLNHPDPWPKEKHQKHRLLQPPFVAMLSTLLRPGGEFWLKSDFEPYGPLAHELFLPPMWEVIASTADLHGEGGELLVTNIQTNYERKSRERGARILVAGFRRRPA
jgi:tRNA (guanine-N7-)-methyltransferase